MWALWERWMLQEPRMSPAVQVFRRLDDTGSTHADGRRRKSAMARNRGRLSGASAAGYGDLAGAGMVGIVDWSGGLNLFRLVELSAILSPGLCNPSTDPLVVVCHGRHSVRAISIGGAMWRRHSLRQVATAMNC